MKLTNNSTGRIKRSARQTLGGALGIEAAGAEKFSAATIIRQQRNTPEAPAIDPGMAGGCVPTRGGVVEWANADASAVNGRHHGEPMIGRDGSFLRKRGEDKIAGSRRRERGRAANQLSSAAPAL